MKRIANIKKRIRLFEKAISLAVVSIFAFSQIALGNDVNLPLPAEEQPIEDVCSAHSAGEVEGWMRQEEQDIERKEIIEKIRGGFNYSINIEEGNEKIDNPDIINPVYDDKGRLISYTENREIETSDYIINESKDVMEITYDGDSLTPLSANFDSSYRITNKDDNSEAEVDISGELHRDEDGQYYLAPGTSVRFYFWSDDNLSTSIKQEYIIEDDTSLETLEKIHSAFLSLITSTNKAKAEFVSQLDSFYKEANMLEIAELQQEDPGDIDRDIVDINIEAEADNTSSNSYTEEGDNQSPSVNGEINTNQGIEFSIPKILIDAKKSYDSHLKNANSDFLSKISEIMSIIKEPILAVSAQGIEALIYIPPKPKD